MVFASHRVFANPRRVSIVGHVDGHTDLLRKSVANILADPVFRQVGLTPDHTVTGRRWNIQSDAANHSSLNPCPFGQFVEGQFELRKSRFEAIFDPAAHLDDPTGLVAMIVD